MVNNSGPGLIKYVKDPKVTLFYPPEQSWPGMYCKPNGSLAYPSLGGALIKAGVAVAVFDACVGNEKDDLQEMFYKSQMMPSGLIRTGVSEQRILEEVAEDLADRGALGEPRPGRERGHRRHWRSPSGRLQDGEPQPPLLH